MSAYKPRIQRKNFFKLNYSQIHTVLLAVSQCLVILLNSLIDGVKPHRITLHHLNIRIGNIFTRP